MMVDHERRKKLAFHLRHLSIGLISNDQFEDRLMNDVTNGWLPEQYYRSKQAEYDDPIVIPMLELCWGLYDDTREHKLVRADQLTEQALQIIARCILFLHSGREYQWPYFDTNSPLFKFSLKDFIIVILTIGRNYRNKRLIQEQSFKEFQKLGDYGYWPFLKKCDYVQQLDKQPFLDGDKAAATNQ